VETEDVYKQLDGMIAEAVRGFAADTHTAPHEWQEAVSMNEKFARMVVARLMGFTIPRYDDATRKGQHKSEEDMSQEEYNKKQKTLARAKALQVGEGELNVPGLGLMVQRFNITKVEPSETLSKALERISQEEQEQKAETVEAETIAKLVIAFLVALGYEPEDMKHPRIRKQALEDEGLTTAEVLRMMRVEREKAQESTQRFSIDTSPAIETAVKKLLGLSKKE
jgi:regulator of protease activity HflC (stomatin/prohibitin superfamily)